MDLATASLPSSRRRRGWRKAAVAAAATVAVTATGLVATQLPANAAGCSFSVTWVAHHATVTNNGGCTYFIAAQHKFYIVPGGGIGYTSWRYRYSPPTGGSVSDVDAAYILEGYGAGAT